MSDTDAKDDTDKVKKDKKERRKDGGHSKKKDSSSQKAPAVKDEPASDETQPDPVIAEKKEEKEEKKAEAKAEEPKAEEKKSEKKADPPQAIKREEPVIKVTVIVKKSQAKIDIKKALKAGILTKVPFKDTSDMVLVVTATSDKGGFKLEVKTNLVTYGSLKDEVKLSQLLKRQAEKREEWSAEMNDPSTSDNKGRNWHFAITPLIDFLKEKVFDVKDG